MKKLKGPSGSLHGIESATPPGQSDKVTRKAILVHAGPGGAPLVFQSSDGEISFDDARIKRIVANQNKMITAIAEQYGGLDKMPIGAFPPILDQHEDDSNDRIIGRMTGLLRYEVLDVPKVGKNVPCAVTDITFLGEDTVKRVADGRIYHLSIGIDEATDTMGETSTVIDPAAPGAMLLKNGAAGLTKLKKGEKSMPATKRLERMQRSAKRLATLGAINKDLTKLTADLKGSADMVKLTKREGEITHRLNKIMKTGRLTPAEYKKLDIKKLSKLSDDAVDTVMESYEAREPQVQPHQRGSTDAVDFATIGKSMEKKKLKALQKETVSDLMRASGGKVKLKSGSHLAVDADKDEDKDLRGGNKETDVDPGHDEHAVPGEGGDVDMKAKFKGHMAKCAAHMEAGEHEDAKKEHLAAMAHMEKHGDKHLSFGVGDTKSEDYKKGMDDMEAKVDELATNLARLAGAVSEMMGEEEKEGHDLAAETDEEVEDKDKQ